MTSSPTRLKADLVRLRDLVGREDLLSVSEEERGRILQQTDDLVQRIEAVEGEFLSIGLLGGTGVGKSSLMNALAGELVSSVSHRRPHTDHVLIYRHEDAPAVPEPPPETILWKEITHRGHAVRQVLLCDLPDFDSLLTAHREGVITFLENLDLLVWVTSPEKYADRRLYEFLDMAPKSRDNFVFVLNKVDAFFEGETAESGFAGLTAASARFADHLRAAGMDSPVLYSVSAREVLEGKTPSPWNQFPLLKQQVFQLRNAKQVRSIKAGNLDVESRRLFSRLDREIQGLNDLSSTLDRAIGQLKEDGPAWERAGREGLRPWLESKAVRRAFMPGRDALPLSGPGLALALLFLRPGRETPGETEADETWRRLTPPEPVVSSLRRRLDWLEDRLVRQMLVEDLPPLLRQRVQTVLRREARFDQIGESLFQVASHYTSSPLLPGMAGFRVVQVLTYALLFLLLVFALGDGSAWQSILESPGWRSGTGLIASFVRTLFSAGGLAALASYALLNLFCGVRFLLSYRKRLNRATDRATAALGEAMAQVWTSQLDAVANDLARLKAEVETRSEALASLGESTGR